MDNDVWQIRLLFINGDVIYIPMDDLSDISWYINAYPDETIATVTIKRQP
jgi:hypothetical protein